MGIFVSRVPRPPQPTRDVIRVKYEGGKFLNANGQAVDVCEWCGCVHTFFCPRIKSVSYYPAPVGGKLGSIESIEFWEDTNAELWESVVELEQADGAGG